MEADLNQLQKESDTLTVRVYDPAVQRPLRQSRPSKPFPESLPRDEKRLLPATPCCPNCGGSRNYLGEDTAEQLELMHSAFRVIRTIRENMPVLSAMPSCRHQHLRGPSSGVSPDRGCWPLVLTSKYAAPIVSPVRNIRPERCGAEPFTAVGLGGCMLPTAVSAGRSASWLCHD